MFCQCFPVDVDAEAAADIAIARFAEVCPDLPDRVVDRLALGPRQLEARFGIAGGHIFHGEMLPGQLLEQRPDRRRFGGGREPLPGRVGRPSGRRGHRRAGPAGRARGARGPLMARCFVTRELPGGALTGCASATRWRCWDGDASRRPTS